MRPVLIPIADRRSANRPPDPVSDLHRSNVEAILRTAMAIYFHCYSCNIVWGEPKPQASHFVREWLEGRCGQLRSRERQARR
jgi:hypothetical protein